MKTVCSFLIVSIGSSLFCKNVYPFIVDGRVGRQYTGVKHRAFTETAENVDHLEKTEGERSREEARALEWERRQKKNKICQSMPRSQKWFKAMQQHVSPNQKRMYNDYWPVHGVDLKYGLKLIPHELFTSNTVTAATAVVLDIGFGMGDSIVGMAQQNTDKIYLGCEIHRAGISTALGNISTLGIANVKIVRADVKMLLDTSLSEKCLDEVCIFFPDPWPNTERDGERRVVRKGR
jgi:Putative methyltransferase